MRKATERRGGGDRESRHSFPRSRSDERLAEDADGVGPSPWEGDVWGEGWGFVLRGRKKESKAGRRRTHTRRREADSLAKADWPVCARWPLAIWKGEPGEGKEGEGKRSRRAVGCRTLSPSRRTRAVRARRGVSGKLVSRARGKVKGEKRGAEGSSWVRDWVGAWENGGGGVAGRTETVNMRNAEKEGGGGLGYALWDLVRSVGRRMGRWLGGEIFGPS